MTFKCDGNGPDHCCYIQNEVCPHLEENTIPGRRWVCGLMRRLGSWDAVHTSVAYLAFPATAWRVLSVPDCGDFIPRDDVCCHEVVA